MLKLLITSYFGRDDASFERAAEALVRQLVLENRVGEAKSIRDALSAAKASFTSSKGLNTLSRPQSGLISFPTPDPQARLFFDPETERSLQRTVAEHRAGAQLAESGLRPKSKLLFWGPPGCGKTAAAFWMASELELPVGIVRLGSLITSYVGETGANLQKVFSAADATPMVLLLDEADAVAKSRSDDNDVGELRRVVNALLQGLDYFAPRRSVAILATNHSFLFDSAIWRRFDDVVSFPLPREAQRLALLKHLTSGLKVNGSLVNVARKMHGRSFAELNRSVLEVAKDSIINSRDQVDAGDFLKESHHWRKKTFAALSRPARGK
jgi:SpoVK/Ycf46/Vps4 family AAA+-type ATPase